MRSEIKTVACVGSGLIGQGWATLFAAAGYSVAMHDLSGNKLARALEQVRSNLNHLEQNGRLQTLTADGAYKLIRTTLNLAEAVQRVPTTDRGAVGILLTMSEHVDVIVPRGGRSLIERIQNESKIPVFSHLEGLNHTYVDATMDLAKASEIVVNAKMRRTGICGATETLLVHKDIAERFLPLVGPALEAKGCELRGDSESALILPHIAPATEFDWQTEYLDSILAIRVVDDIDEAIAHISRYGSKHTEAILSDDPAALTKFANEVDAGIVMQNASTQFADGGEFGLGAEIGISTGKMHARGPVGANELTSYKYIVVGTGQTRP